MQAKCAIIIMLFCMLVQVALFVPYAEAVVSCGQVQSGLAPCLKFLQGGQLTKQCCAGVKSVAASAKTVVDRRASCRCLVASAKNMKGLNFKNAAALPGRCGVGIPFQISPTTDCSRVG